MHFSVKLLLYYDTGEIKETMYVFMEIIFRLVNIKRIWNKMGHLLQCIVFLTRAHHLQSVERFSNITRAYFKLNSQLHKIWKSAN